MPTSLTDVAQYTLSRRQQPQSKNPKPHVKKVEQPRNADKLDYTPIEMSITTLRNAIPKHYFERSLFWSSAWLLHDLLLVTALFYFATYIDPLVSTISSPGLGSTLSTILWCAYWVVQGIVCTGLWVIAHECGHQAFCSSKTINNAVGWVLHSALLVPYHSWRITHSRHHKSTNHLDLDQVFVPRTRQELVESSEKLRQRNSDPNYDAGYDSLLEDTPLFNMASVLFMLLLGWPAYLFYNASGLSYPEYGWTSHFFPTAPFFEARDYWNIVFSDVGVLGTLGLLGYGSYTLGFTTIVKYYLIPYLFVNMWLVIITFLQHTHPNIPHYDKESFTFLRGALSTVDRDYGILNYFFHNIGDSHVVHHLFSTMPHYYAIKATPIVRNMLRGTPYYHLDTSPIAKALWQSWSNCKFVEPLGKDSKVYWYNN